MGQTSQMSKVGGRQDFGGRSPRVHLPGGWSTSSLRTLALSQKRPDGASNEYPISRDLFIYVNTGTAEENPALVAFVEHYLSFGLDEAAAEVGYVELTEEAKAEAVAAWDGR
jgi:ABC-type proline/glycine betaine transport system substrate-binding protein